MSYLYTVETGTMDEVYVYCTTTDLDEANRAFDEVVANMGYMRWVMLHSMKLGERYWYPREDMPAYGTGADLPMRQKLREHVRQD